MAIKNGLLSDLQLKQWIKAAAPCAKSDGNGLTFTISRSGHAVWVLRYRHGQRRYELTLGRYPDIGLADARATATLKRADIHLASAARRLKAQRRLEASGIKAEWP